MQKSTPCGEYKQRQRKGDRQAKPNSNGMWETVAHGIYRQNYLKMAGPERTRFARRGNLIEIKFSSPKLGIAVGPFARDVQPPRASRISSLSMLPLQPISMPCR